MIWLIKAIYCKYKGNHLKKQQQSLRGITNKPIVEIKWNHKNIGMHSTWASLCSIWLVTYVKIARPWLLFHLDPWLRNVNTAGNFERWDHVFLKQRQACLLLAIKVLDLGFSATMQTHCVCTVHLGPLYHLLDLELREPTQNYADIHVVWCAMSNKLFWLDTVSLIVYFWYPWG